GAGLLVQSFVRLRQVNPGFDPNHVLTFWLGLPAVKYADAQQAEFFRQLGSRISAVPRLRSASSRNPLPLCRSHMEEVFEIEGHPAPLRERPETNYRGIMPDYFRTMGIPLVKGRDFTVRDDLNSPPVVVINETLARRYFPNEDPIGKHIRPSI